MSSGRTVVGFLVGIAAVIGAHFAFDVKTQDAPRALRRNSLEPFAEKMTFFSVERPGEPPVRLAKGDDGAWNIVSPYAAKAEQSTVLRLADALAFAPVADEMTDAELLRIGRTREDFGLNGPRVVVTVGDSGKGTSTPIRFGVFTPAGDGVYATVGESDTVYVVATNIFAAVNLDAAGFRCRRVFQIEPDDIAAFDVKSGAGHFVRLVRDENAWKVSEPRECASSPERVRSFLNAVTRLQAQNFAWPTGATNETQALSGTLLAGYGLVDDAMVSVTLRCADGKNLALGLGNESGKGQVYALTPDGAVVTVPAAVRAMAATGMDAFVDSRIFPLEASAVNAISIDDDDAKYLLSRSANAAWRLDVPVSAAADADAVDGLMRRILSLKTSDVATNGVRISVGTNAAPVSVARQSLLAGFRLEDLRSKEILSADPKLVRRVVVTDAGQTAVAVLFDAEKGAWSVERADSPVAVDGEAIGKMLGFFRPLKAVRIVRLKVGMAELAKFGLDKPFRTIAIDQTDENAVRWNFLIGDVTDGGRFATIGASDAVFVISSESAAALLAPIVK